MGGARPTVHALINPTIGFVGSAHDSHKQRPARACILPLALGMGMGMGMWHFIPSTVISQHLVALAEAMTQAHTANLQLTHCQADRPSPSRSPSLALPPVCHVSYRSAAWACHHDSHCSCTSGGQQGRQPCVANTTIICEPPCLLWRTCIDSVQLATAAPCILPTALNVDNTASLHNLAP